MENLQTKYGFSDEQIQDIRNIIAESITDILPILMESVTPLVVEKYKKNIQTNTNFGDLQNDNEEEAREYIRRNKTHLTLLMKFERPLVFTIY